MRVNELGDGVDEFLEIAEHAPADVLVGQFTQPAFNEVQPRRTGRREMEVKARVALEPSPHLGMFMGRVERGR